MNAGTPSLMLRLAVWSAALAGIGSHAYVIDSGAWPSGDITMQLQLGAPPAPLLDGNTQWDDVGQAALQRWNVNLGRSRFVAVKNSAAARAYGNGSNNVFFSSNIYGDAFGDRVLAVTLRRGRSSGTAEADVVVNSALSWNSYRGGLRAANDLERVLVHEFGHVLGLGHPDEDTPPQSVAAIMNSRISSLYTLQADDIAGVNALYASGVTAPTTVSGLTDKTVSAGAPLTLSYSASGSNLTYEWTFTPTGRPERELLNGDGEPWTSPTFSLFSAQPSDSGTYSVRARNAAGASPVSSARVSVNAVSTAEALLANLSARGRAGSGSDTFIVGFVVSGTSPKSVLVRAVGPTLASQGVGQPLADPSLKLIRSDGETFSLVGENDNWSTDATAAQALRSAAQRLGAFALPDGSKDAALLLTLQPGVYSAHAEAQSGSTGIVLVEAYDADASLAQSLPRRLVNVSTRSFAGTGEQQLIAGFVVSGTTPKQVLIRALGPALTGRGVQNANADPNLTLFKGATQIADNDDWAYSNQTDILPAAFAKVGTSTLAEGSYDSALLITLPPAVYTARAAGRSGETGVILLEVFEMSP